MRTYLLSGLSKFAAMSTNLTSVLFTIHAYGLHDGLNFCLRQSRRMKKTYPQLRKLATVLGQELRAARLERQWTQEQLSEAVHIGRVTISNMETGDVNPSVMTFVHLATALGLRPSALLESALLVLEQRTGEKLEKLFKVAKIAPATRPHRPRRRTPVKLASTKKRTK
jgi:transcriptional regulator with XRE-family HTH domain